MAIMSVTSILTPIIFSVYTYFLFKYYGYAALIITAIIVDVIFLIFYVCCFKETLPVVKKISVKAIATEIKILFGSSDFLVNFGFFIILGGLIYSVFFTIPIVLRFHYHQSEFSADCILSELIGMFILGSFVSRLCSKNILRYIFISSTLIVISSAMMIVMYACDLNFIMLISITLAIISFSSAMIQALVNTYFGTRFKEQTGLIPGLTSGIRSLVMSITMPYILHTTQRGFIELIIFFGTITLVLMLVQLSIHGSLGK